MNLKSFNVKAIFGFLLTIFVVVIIYLFNRYTNIKIDDYSYKFIYPYPNYDFKVRVLNFANVITSQIIHYNYVNGRYLTHVFVQYFLMFDSKIYFDILNTIFLLLFLLLIYFSLSENPANNWIKFALFLALLFVGYPNPSFTYTWLTGSINYTWAFVFNLSFVLLVLKEFLEKKKINILFLFLIFLLGLTAGSMHELASLAVFPSIFSTVLFIKKGKVNWWKFVLLIGNVGTSILLIFSPGNFLRATSSKSELSVFDFIINTSKSLIVTSVDLLPFFLLIIIVVFGLIKKRNSLHSNNPLILFTLLFSLINLVFIILVQNFQPRAYFFINSFSIVCLFNYINRWEYLNHKLSQVVIGTSTIFVLLYFLNIQRDFKKDFDQFENAVQNSNNNLFGHIQETKSRYLTYGLAGLDPFHWQNKIMSIYYRKDFFVILMPEQVLDAKNKASIVNNNKPAKFTEYVKLAENQFLIPIPKDIDTLGISSLRNEDFQSQISHLLKVNSLPSNLEYNLISYLDGNNYLLLKVKHTN